METVCSYLSKNEHDNEAFEEENKDQTGRDIVELDKLQV